MMENKYFSFRLYKEGLKQLRLLGVISLLILGLVAVLIPVGSVISYSNYVDASWLPDIVSILTLNPLIVFMFIAVAPILTLNIFKFLNKRNSSDFYHAIPQKRLSIFASFFAAVLTWVTAILLICVVLSLGIAAAFPQYFMVDWTNSIAIIFSVWAGSVFVAAAVAVAMCITGTMLTNVIVAGLIIFVPRFLIFMISAWSTYATPIVAGQDLFPLMDAKFNVVTGMFLGIIENYTMSGLFSQWSGGIYTLVIGILYTGAAAFLFHKRKSESAGFSAPNRMLQAVYRITITTVFCLIPINIIYSSSIYEYRMDFSDLFALFILYLFGVIGYFLFELITTKKLKNLVKAIPGLAIVAGLNILIILLLGWMYRAPLSIKPAADQISYVQFIAEEDWTGNKDFFEGMTEQVEVKDEEIRSIIAERLAFNIELWENSSESYYNESNRRGMQRRPVAIKTNKGTYYRNIILSEEDIMVIAEKLSQMDDYTSVYEQLPALEDMTATVSVDYLSAKDTETLYETMREEVDEMTFEEWYSIASSTDYSYASTMLDVISFNCMIGSSQYYSDLPITMKMEKTAAKYMELINGNIDKLIKTIDEATENEDVEVNLELQMYQKQSDGTWEVYSLDYYQNTAVYVVDGEVRQESTRDGLGELKELLQEASENGIDLDGDICYVNIHTYDPTRSNNNWQDYSGYFSLSMEELPEELIKQLVKQEY